MTPHSLQVTEESAAHSCMWKGGALDPRPGAKSPLGLQPRGH